MGLVDAPQLLSYGSEVAGSYKRRVRRAAAVLSRMERTNRRVARDAVALPTDRTEIVKYGQVVLCRSRIRSEFQATILSIVADEL